MTLTTAHCRGFFCAINRHMASPNIFDSKVPTVYPCLVCGTLVHSVRNEGLDKYGRHIVWYTPSSRYWTDGGVFCSAEHSLEHSLKVNSGNS